MKNVHFLIIDPQNDFCDPNGSLFVEGAPTDVKKISRMLDGAAENISEIHVTLDTHHYHDIAHPGFWTNERGEQPPPFTIISTKDVETGIWAPVNEKYSEWALTYTRGLAKNDRFALCVWPPHCLIGSWGTQVAEPLSSSLLNWERKTGRTVNYVTKGENPLTEHYSAFQADVPRSDDPKTQFNQQLFDRLKNVDHLLIAGEALSHCVRFTTLDLLDRLHESNYRKVTVLKDASSPVPGFQSTGVEFLSTIQSKGVQVALSSSMGLT